MKPSSRYRRIPISSVFVPRSERQRSQLEIEALKASISKIGLLQPIVVEPFAVNRLLSHDVQYHFPWRLIAGECRLEACRELGWTEIHAIALSDITEIDSQIAELEENIKRTNLNWKDFCSAVAKIHQMFTERNQEWSQLETAEALSITQGKLSEQLRVFEYMDDPRVQEAGTLREAYNIIQRKETRQRSEALMDLLEEQEEEEQPQIEEQQEKFSKGNGGSIITTSPNANKSSVLTRERAQLEAESTILNISFLDWAPTYSGQKFNFLHCDFPYGISHGTGPQSRGSEPQQIYEDSIQTYQSLLSCLTENLERILSISAHVMFWFSDRHRRLTIKHFHIHTPSLKWHVFPLIWLKSDNSGIIPDNNRSPRHVYETCMIGSRGDRMLVRPMADAYASRSDHSLHPSCKPEPMLRHFMTMFVDENTRMLDPTCGSGSSIRAAEHLGAKTTLGLEINREYWESATKELRNRRILQGLQG